MPPRREGCVSARRAAVLGFAAGAIVAVVLMTRLLDVSVPARISASGAMSVERYR